MSLDELAARSRNQRWDEREHPRGRDGKFIHKNGVFRIFANTRATHPFGSGKAESVNPDGSINVRILSVEDQFHPGYVGRQTVVFPDQLETIEQKARLDLDDNGFPKRPTMPQRPGYQVGDQVVSGGAGAGGEVIKLDNKGRMLIRAPGGYEVWRDNRPQIKDPEWNEWYGQRPGYDDDAARATDEPIRIDGIGAKRKEYKPRTPWYENDPAGGGVAPDGRNLIPTRGPRKGKKRAFEPGRKSETKKKTSVQVDFWRADMSEYDPQAFDNAMISMAASAALTACGGEVDFFDVESIDDELMLEEVISEGGHFVIPLLIPEEVETGDGRTFKKDSLTTRDLPIPLLWQIQTGDGHDGSVLVGRIDHVERVDGGLGNAYGVFDTGPHGMEAERLVRGGFLRGISADLDQFEANVKDEEAAEAAADADDEDVKDKIKSDKVVVTKGRVMAATLVPKPAFQECFIAMSDQFDVSDADLLEDGVYEEEIEDPDAMLAALTAAAAPLTPPKDWFKNPELKEPTPITVSDDGRVFGHIASWQTDHIGMGGRKVRPPQSGSGYRYFRTGVLRTQEGEDVAVGQLTLAGGHAPLQADASAAVKHYDDTASAVADVTAGEDAYGIWVAGALRPSVTPEQVRVLRASAPSGDWRPINGRLELVAVCQVNVPGFPVARAMVAGGHVTALVAAGARQMAELREEPIKTLTTRVDQIEQAELRRLREAAAARVSPLQQKRREALVAAAEAARSRIQPARDRRAELTAEAQAARERLLALKLSPQRTWDEKKHPRDIEGKFRAIIARLGDILTGIDGADEATRKIESAADFEDTGSGDAARDTAREARAHLTGLEEKATDPATLARIKEAEREIDAAIGEAKTEAPEPEMDETPVPQTDSEPRPAPETDSEPKPAPESGGEGAPSGVVAELIEEAFNSPPSGPVGRLLSWFINQLVAAVDPTQALRNAPAEITRMLEGKQFQNTEELASYIQELIRRAVSPI